LKPILLDYVDREKNPDLCEEFKAHSRSCSDCYRKYNFEVGFKNLFKTKFKAEIVSEELIHRIKIQIKKLQKDISLGEKGW